MFTIALRDYWRIATAITATELELGSSAKKQVLYCVGSRKLGRLRALATAFQGVIPTLTATGGLLMNVCFYLDTLHEGGLVSEYPVFCILDPAPTSRCETPALSSVGYKFAFSKVHRTHHLVRE
jgi:hypothetical protein